MSKHSRRWSSLAALAAGLALCGCGVGEDPSAAPAGEDTHVLRCTPEDMGLVTSKPGAGGIGQKKDALNGATATYWLRSWY